MMPKQQLNKLKWKGELQIIWTFTDRDDRPAEYRQKKRDLFYVDAGVTSNEKYLSIQAKREVIRRIRIRLDNSINELINGVNLDGIDYMITRIYRDAEKREMELSLGYVG